MSKKKKKDDEKSYEKNPIVFFDISVKDNPPLPQPGEKKRKDSKIPQQSTSSTPFGKILIELFYNDLKKTCENFRCLCTHEKGKNKGGVQLTYKNSIFHKIVPGFSICGGDIELKRGKNNNVSIYGSRFDEDTKKFPHVKYSVSMNNSKGTDNASQFFICMDDMKHLDEDHICFGKVVKGFDVLDKIEKMYKDVLKRNEDGYVGDDKRILYIEKCNIFVENEGEVEKKKV